MNNIAVSENDFKCEVYRTDTSDQAKKEIVFSSNLAVGLVAKKLPVDAFFFSTLSDLKLGGAFQNYKTYLGSSATGLGDSFVLEAIPNDKEGIIRQNPPDLGAYNVDDEEITSLTSVTRSYELSLAGSDELS